MKKSEIKLSEKMEIAFKEMHQKMAESDLEFKVAIYFLAKATELSVKAFCEQPNEQLPNPILLRVVLDPATAEDVIANLEHYYSSVWRKRHRPFTAKAIFYAQNVRVIFSHYGKVLRDTLELYVKLS